MSGFFEDKIKGPVVKLLKSGGIFPVPGLTTLPVMLFIFLFRLNPVAAMLTNYLCTPLNIASVPVFILYGNSYFGSGEGAQEFSVAAFTSDLKADPLNTLLLFRFTLLNAIFMWLATVPVVVGAIYVVLTPLLKRVMPKQPAQDAKKSA